MHDRSDVSVEAYIVANVVFKDDIETEIIRCWDVQTTLWGIKTRQLFLGHNFYNTWPILIETDVATKYDKIFQLHLNNVANSQLK